MINQLTWRERLHNRISYWLFRQFQVKQGPLMFHIRGKTGTSGIKGDFLMSIENKVDKFFWWLSQETDYGDWHDNVKREVRDKLIEVLNEPEPKQHNWEFYTNGTFCKICGASIGSGMPCR